MPTPFSKLSTGTAAACACLFAIAAHAAPQRVTVTVENLAPANSVTVAPLHFGFHSGVFDAFDKGGVAGPGIISVAEGGSGSAWQPAFAAADPGAARGTVGGSPLGPGGTASLSLIVDPLVTPYFTFAAMVVPSNDFFIGNDAPTALKVFDAGGNLVIPTIGQKARQIWDAGSEVYDPSAAAFIMGSTGSNRTPQNSVVAFNFAEFYAYSGMTTAAGYVFDPQLAADTDIYRISFAVSAVPEPQTHALFAAGLLAVGYLSRRRRG